MTLPDLDALEIIARISGPGPWRSGGVDTRDVGRVYLGVGVSIVDCLNSHDPEVIAAFIAAANPTAVLALIEEVRRLRALVRFAFDEANGYDDSGSAEWEDSESRAKLEEP